MVSFCLLKRKIRCLCKQLRLIIFFYQVWYTSGFRLRTSFIFLFTCFPSHFRTSKTSAKCKQNRGPFYWAPADGEKNLPSAGSRVEFSKLVATYCGILFYRYLSFENHTTKLVQPYFLWSEIFKTIKYMLNFNFQRCRDNFSHIYHITPGLWQQDFYLLELKISCSYSEGSFDQRDTNTDWPFMASIFLTS